MLYVGGPFTTTSFFQMPPEVGATLGKTAADVPEYVDAINCPDGCYIDLATDPEERSPLALTTDMATWKAEFDQFNTDAVPNLWESHAFDYTAIQDLYAKGYTWPWLDES